MQVSDRFVVLSTLIVFGQLMGIPVVGEAQRQHRAHVHGAGKLNLVQEGSQVHIELELPGMDVAGFEHKARTASQKQAVKDAVTALEQGSALFRMNAEAKCTFDKAEIEVSMMDDDGEGEHGHEGDKHQDDDHHRDEKHAGEVGESHSEFHAEYVFQCASPEKLQQLQVTLFDTFKGAENLQVQFVTARKQGAQRISREVPVIRFD
ncbi:DUF2796 domain-containing protein [Candidatus Entotheonella palauensis]|uniref:DUF2796 domain-containing protein n=1 Tax=Candidatus Entotheonella gemina TaxID=1429439 RepID=W4M5D0_9BACT|nr:DUF2796 domain-containing protein [Candidatus Entotheonella palauensis]ETX05383.1 MAG: hypothetical protein ETSY2_23275 [Candidatus Entotheonella gemina]